MEKKKLKTDRHQFSSKSASRCASSQTMRTNLEWFLAYNLNQTYNLYCIMKEMRYMHNKIWETIFLEV